MVQTDHRLPYLENVGHFRAFLKFKLQVTFFTAYIFYPWNLLPISLRGLKTFLIFQHFPFEIEIPVSRKWSAAMKMTSKNREQNQHTSYTSIWIEYSQANQMKRLHYESPNSRRKHDQQCTSKVYVTNIIFHQFVSCIYTFL